MTPQQYHAQPQMNELSHCVVNVDCDVTKDITNLECSLAHEATDYHDVVGFGARSQDRVDVFVGQLPENNKL